MFLLGCPGFGTLQSATELSCLLAPRKHVKTCKKRSKGLLRSHLGAPGWRLENT